MSTFTTRSGVTSCDTCDEEVRNNWRTLARHVCPRVVPDPFARYCELASCAKPLVQRPNESVYSYARRRYCGRSCANTISGAARKAS